MFVYKITNKINGKMYIGMDSKPVDEQNRWNTHLKQYKNLKSKKLLYMAMRKYGHDNFKYEVIKSKIQTRQLLMDSEIHYIKQYDSLSPNGYNLTKGGDGGNTLLGYSQEQLQLSNQNKSNGQKQRWITASQSNKDKHSRNSTRTNHRRWNKQTAEEKKSFTDAHLHSLEANIKRSKTIEAEWADMAIGDKEHKLRGLDQYRKDNKGAFAEQARINGRKAIEITAASFMVRDPYGNEYIMKNKSRFKRDIRIDTNTIRYNTKLNRAYKGWWIWNIDDEGNKID